MAVMSTDRSTDGRDVDGDAAAEQPAICKMMSMLVGQPITGIDSIECDH
jgi:hypothetical protein